MHPWKLPHKKVCTCQQLDLLTTPALNIKMHYINVNYIRTYYIVSSLIDRGKQIKQAAMHNNTRE